MLGDLIEAMLDGISPPGGNSKRAEVVARLLFGLVGAALGVAGIVKFVADPGLTSNIALRASMVLLFASMTAFCMFNVALLRGWRWPGRLFVLSLVAIFVTRFIGGA